MQMQEYMQDLLRELSDDLCGTRPVRVGRYDCLHAQGVRTFPVRSDVIINRAERGVSLAYVQDYADANKEFLLNRYTFLESAFLARIGIATIVSQQEVSDGVSVYIESGIKKYPLRNIHVVPIVVDLRNEDVITPKHAGFLVRYPLLKNIAFAREKISLGGRLKVR